MASTRFRRAKRRLARKQFKGTKRGLEALLEPNEDIFELQAKVAHRQYSELTRIGFTDEQAVMLVTELPLPAKDKRRILEPIMEAVLMCAALVIVAILLIQHNF